MTVNQQMMELKLRPVLSYMRKIVSNLQKKDPANIFAEPVTIEEVSMSGLESKEVWRGGAVG